MALADRSQRKESAAYGKGSKDPALGRDNPALGATQLGHPDVPNRVPALGDT